jgi:hypothetical protein
MLYGGDYDEAWGPKARRGSPMRPWKETDAIEEHTRIQSRLRAGKAGQGEKDGCEAESDAYESEDSVEE